MGLQWRKRRKEKEGRQLENFEDGGVKKIKRTSAKRI